MYVYVSYFVIIHFLWKMKKKCHLSQEFRFVMYIVVDNRNYEKKSFESEIFHFVMYIVVVNMGESFQDYS